MTPHNWLIQNLLAQFIIQPITTHLVTAGASGQLADIVHIINCYIIIIIIII